MNFHRLENGYIYYLQTFELSINFHHPTHKRVNNDIKLCVWIPCSIWNIFFISFPIFFIYSQIFDPLMSKKKHISISHKPSVFNQSRIVLTTKQIFEQVNIIYVCIICIYFDEWMSNMLITFFLHMKAPKTRFPIFPYYFAYTVSW